MRINRKNMRPGAIGFSAGAVLAGAIAATIAAPTAAAAPDCSAGAVSGTVNSATAPARGYLMSHPGADQAVAAAYAQPQTAASTLRSYFTANPTEYHQLRGILAPIGDTQRQCNVNVLPAGLSMAYDQFMAG